MGFPAVPIADNIRQIIRHIGDDPDREGLKETPDRVVRSYAELFSGYHHQPQDVFKTFDSDGYDELILLKGIEFYSTCEHHLLPFVGTAHVGYIPQNGLVVGLSKLARLVEIFSRRLQMQERLTVQIVSALDEFLKPAGAACVIEASHMCVACRGVQKQRSVMVTSKLSGVFLTDISARAELFQLIRK